MTSRDIDDSSENVLSEWPQEAEPEQTDSDDDQHVSTADDGARAWGTSGATTEPESVDSETLAVAEPEPTLEPDQEEMPFEPDVILELKFTARFPNWYRTLVEAFDLMQSSAAKYADGIAVVGEQRLAPEALSLERDDLVERYLNRRKLRLARPVLV